MTYRLPSERVRLELEGPSVEVERIGAWPIYRTALHLVSGFYRAADGDGQASAIAEIYPYFLAEAQPTWDIADHRGPVPPTVNGMYRLPLALGLAIVQGWLETFGDKPTAVDEVIPPGPLRDELNAGLRAKRKKT